MATFTTNHAVVFDSDLDLLSLLTNKANYHNFTAQGFTAFGGAIPLPSVEVNGTFTNTGPVTGTVTGLTLHLPNGGGDFTFSGLSIGLDTLITDLQAGTSVAVWALFGDPSNTVNGSAGNDHLLAYPTGAFTIHGGGGADTIIGGEGDAHFYGGGGNDKIYGGNAASYLFGGGGNDKVVGGSGTSFLYGGAGNDKLFSLNSSTHAYGGGGDDVLTGNGNLYGGAGDDRLVSGPSGDVLQGGAGKDTLIGKANAYDAADYTDRTAAIAVHLAGSTNVTVLVGGKAEDTIRNIDDVFGTKYGDHITGDSRGNIIEGNGGKDVLKGAAGEDTLIGGNGVDTLMGGAGQDTLKGGFGRDVLTGGAGIDNFYLLSDSETFTVANVDFITDFQPGTDVVWLSRYQFGNLPKSSSLFDGNFALGSPQDDTDYIIYDQKTGRLFYDDDGNGTHAARLAAVFTNHAHLSAHDFLIA